MDIKVIRNDLRLVCFMGILIGLFVCARECHRWFRFLVLVWFNTLWFSLPCLCVVACCDSKFVAVVKFLMDTSVHCSLPLSMTKSP